MWDMIYYIKGETLLACGKSTTNTNNKDEKFIKNYKKKKSWVWFGCIGLGWSDWVGSGWIILDCKELVWVGLGQRVLGWLKLGLFGFGWVR